MENENKEPITYQDIKKNMAQKRNVPTEDKPEKDINMDSGVQKEIEVETFQDEVSTDTENSDSNNATSLNDENMGISQEAESEKQELEEDLENEVTLPKVNEKEEQKSIPKEKRKPQPREKQKPLQKEKQKSPEKNKMVKEKKEKKQKPKVKLSRKSKFTVAAVLLCLFISVLMTTNVISLTGIISFLNLNNEQATQGAVNEYKPEIIDVNSNSLSEGDILATTADNEQERLNAIAENSRVYCVISSSPYFSSSSEKGLLYISNPAESIYYTQVVIKTKDTNEELYVSPLMPPDTNIEQDYLSNREILPGEHISNAYFNYYTQNDNEEYSYIGTICAEITVVIDQ